MTACILNSAKHEGEKDWMGGWEQGGGGLQVQGDFEFGVLRG